MEKRPEYNSFDDLAHQSNFTWGQVSAQWVSGPAGFIHILRKRFYKVRLHLPDIRAYVALVSKSDGKWSLFSAFNGPHTDCAFGIADYSVGPALMAFHQQDYGVFTKVMEMSIEGHVRSERCDTVGVVEAWIVDQIRNRVNCQ